MNELPGILLAEDNENDIELTLRAFRENNLHNCIDVVNDGEQVLDYLFRRGSFADRPHENPVVVLLDIKMPKLDGIDVLREIRNSKEFKFLPVVMLTSSSLDQDIMESYKLGVNAYVVKPVEFTNFIDAIKHVGVFWALLNKTTY